MTQGSPMGEVRVWVGGGLRWGRTRGHVLGVRLERDRACARRKAQEGVVFALCARGFGVFAFNACSGLIPLLPLGGAVGGVWDG